jgi:hypothetical protein
VPLGQGLETRLTAIWHAYLPQPSPQPRAPFGVGFRAPRIPAPQKRDPGLARTLFAFNHVVLPAFSTDAAVRGVAAVILYALDRIYWSARLNYKISDKTRRHQGETKYIIVKQLEFDPKHVPKEFVWAAELAQFLWPLLPALVRLRRAQRTPDAVLLWCAQFANASFVVWVQTPGHLLLDEISTLAREVALRKIWGPARKSAANDYAGDYVAQLIARTHVERFVQRYEPLPVDSIEEAAGKAVAYLMKSMRRAIASSALGADAPHSVSTAKRWRAKGHAPKTLAELEGVASEMDRRRKHQVLGYLSQVQVAKYLRRARSSVQNAIKKAVAAGAIVLGPKGRLAPEDVPKLAPFL